MPRPYHTLLASGVLKITAFRVFNLFPKLLWGFFVFFFYFYEMVTEVLKKI